MARDDAVAIAGERAVYESATPEQRDTLKKEKRAWQADMRKAWGGA